MGNKTENTVRLIVRLTHQRQSILRVNPNEPLQCIYELVLTKLHLKAVKNLEFRHPLHGLDKGLDMKKSLNDYNKRDVFLLKNIESLPKERKTSKSTKRVAPSVPPSNSPKTETKTKPTKRRAPAPPPTDKNSKVNESKENLVEDLYQEIGENSMAGTLEDENLATGMLDQVLNDDDQGESQFEEELCSDEASEDSFIERNKINETNEKFNSSQNIEDLYAKVLKVSKKTSINSEVIDKNNTNKLETSEEIVIEKELTKVKLPEEDLYETTVADAIDPAFNNEKNQKKSV